MDLERDKLITKEYKEEGRELDQGKQFGNREMALEIQNTVNG